MVQLKGKRKWIYVQRPKVYGLPACACGNDDPDWSEFVGHLWCGACEIDFVPKEFGVFDGPIPINASHLLGLCFSRLDIETQQVVSGPCCRGPRTEAT